MKSDETGPEEPEKRQQDALALLDEDKRHAYQTLSDGITKLEDKLPAECTDDTRPIIGDIILRCKAIEKFASEVFHSVADPWNEKIRLQRDLWRPIGERAATLMRKAEGLAEKLIADERKRREEADAAARALVAQKMTEQAAAEAKAMSADSPEMAEAAKKQADEAWALTRAAVQALDQAPATTRVKVGDATVYEASRLDFEITDIAALAKAHPDVIEVRRGPLLAGLRAALSGAVTLPDTLPGWPGIKLKLKKTTSSRG